MNNNQDPQQFITGALVVLGLVVAAWIVGGLILWSI